MNLEIHCQCTACYNKYVFLPSRTHPVQSTFSCGMQQYTVPGHFLHLKNCKNSFKNIALIWNKSKTEHKKIFSLSVT